jgi:Spy/CpxP family protein refolding chaperone
MKNHVMATLTLLAFCMTAAPESHALPPDPAPGMANVSFPSPDQVIQMLVNRLALSPDQADRIYPVIVERQQQIKALLADPNVGVLAARRRMQAIFVASDAKINSMLTPDQGAQYAVIEQQMRAQLRAR